MADNMEQCGARAGRAPAGWKGPFSRSRVASAPSGPLEPGSLWRRALFGVEEAPVCAAAPARGGRGAPCPGQVSALNEPPVLARGGRAGLSRRGRVAPACLQRHRLSRVSGNTSALSEFSAVSVLRGVFFCSFFKKMIKPGSVSVL